MKNEDFQKELKKYKAYLKPELYEVFVKYGEAFLDNARKLIIEKLQEADAEMRELAAYQQKRIEIRKKGLEKLEKIYEQTKSEYQEMVSEKEGAEKEEAEKLLTNL